MTLTIPTMLTIFRIILIPVMVVVFYLPYGWTNIAAAAVFILGAVTDWLDGWTWPCPGLQDASRLADKQRTPRRQCAYRAVPGDVGGCP